MVFLASCEQQIRSPAPKITGLNPLNINAGQPSFLLEVDGVNFTPSSLVLWNLNGSQVTLVTTFVTTKEIEAEVPAADIINPGTASISVETLPPGGGTTTTLPFTIEAVGSGIPQISNISPPSVVTGGASFTLIVNGSGFVNRSTVTVNSSIRTTEFESSTELEATVLQSDIATGGTLQIAVVNPAPGGGSSSFVNLPVVNPVPFLSSASPVSILAGSGGTTVTLAGSGFVPDSVVTVNGAARTTNFTNGTSVQAALTAGDFAAAGVDAINVVNPADGGRGGGTSSTVAFAVNGTELSGLPVIADLGPEGVQANDGICGATCPGGGVPTITTAGPSASQTGEFIAFASDSTNLIVTPPVITSSSIFLRDTCFSNVVKSGGSSSCVPQTTLVSVAPNGAVANGASSEPTIDSGGTNVAFTSLASNLVNYVVVPGTTRQVYWSKPCTTGAASCTTGTPNTALVSVSADGTSPGNGDSYNPVISSDGRYVAFVSLATNLVTTPPAGGFDGITPQVFIHDTCTVVPPLTLGGCTPTSYLVSVSPDGSAAGNGQSSTPSIAEDGLFVAFVSTATNLVPGSNPSGLNEVFERSTCVTTLGTVGNTCGPVTSLISTPDGVTPADGTSMEPAISQDGRFVAFASTGQNLIPGIGPTQEIYLRDTCTGVLLAATTCTPETMLASTPDGVTPANGLSEAPSVSQCSSVTTVCTTGQPIAFASLASNLSPNVENGVENIFVRNPCLNVPATSTSSTTGCVPFTLLASTPAGTNPTPTDGKSVAPSISGDGNTVSFLSFADNLVPNDSNALEDVFLAGANLKFTLTVTVQQTKNMGSGTVSDNTGQISCTVTAGTNGTPTTFTGTCSATYLSGTAITLTATPTTKSTFVTWGGSVIGPNCIANETDDTSCTFAAVQNNTATAAFQ
jgi:hypothetical protein